MMLASAGHSGHHAPHQLAVGIELMSIRIVDVSERDQPSGAVARWRHAHELALVSCGDARRQLRRPSIGGSAHDRHDSLSLSASDFGRTDFARHV